MKRMIGPHCMLFWLVLGLIGIWLNLMSFDLDNTFFSMILIAIGVVGLMDHMDKRPHIPFLEASVTERMRRAQRAGWWFLLAFLMFLSYELLGGTDIYLLFIFLFLIFLPIILIVAYLILIDAARYVEKRIGELGGP